MTKINDDTVKLYIGGINPGWSSDVIKSLLQTHSGTEIMRVDVVKNFAFAFVATKEGSQKVIEKVDGNTIEGCQLVVQISKNKQNLPDSDDLCFECGKSGHWAKECAKRRARTGMRRPMRGGPVGRGRGSPYGYGRYPPGREREVYGGYDARGYEMDPYAGEYYARDPYYRDPYAYAMPRYPYDYGRYQAADIYGQGSSARYGAASSRYMYPGGY